MSDSHSRTTSDSTLVDLAPISEDTICTGCQLTATDESGGGFVIAFGEYFFHVDCFKCGKCGDRLTGADPISFSSQMDGPFAQIVHLIATSAIRVSLIIPYRQVIISTRALLQMSFLPQSHRRTRFCPH
ncbi:hypothetical protein BC826DRAFT_265434 [Russula brevipes]|nr:hypothetical protein BC826DRAFT_265434 [Russula brevipes]